MPEPVRSPHLPREFAPGFRFSRLDAVVLLFFAAAAAWLWPIDRWPAIIVLVVVAHFFLFCNILRVPRFLELAWAGVFVALAGAASLLGDAWQPAALAAIFAATLIVGIVTLRRPSYHGVGWQTINPRLPDWWQQQAHAGGVPSETARGELHGRSP